MRLKDRELPEDNSSSAGVSTSSGTMGSFPLFQAVGCAARALSHTYFLISQLLSGPATGHSTAASVRHGLTAPSFNLLAPPISYPCSDANGGIDLLPIGSSDWLTL